MLVKIKRFIAKSYGEAIKEDLELILADLVLLFMILSGMLAADSLFKDITVTLFDITYNLDILAFYFLSFIFILTTGSLFRELRTLLNVISRFIITRFPRMKGDFSPAKSILRDMVQVLMLTLVFYPVAGLVEAFSFRGYFLLHIVSLVFIVLTMIFIYDITKNTVKIISQQFQDMTKGIAVSNAQKFELQAETGEF